MNPLGKDGETAETRTSRSARTGPSDGRPRRYRESFDEAVVVREYLLTLRERWSLIASTTILAMLVTGVITEFVMTKWYRAEAIIRPVGANNVQSRLSGFLGGISGAIVSAGGMLGDEAISPASEYMPVLKGFNFTTRLITAHHLESHLAVRSRSLFGGGSGDPDWVRYRAMRKRFDCEFSNRTGNIALYYQDSDRAMAGKVLGYYIADLRELLRQQEIHDAMQAIASLRTEAKETPDSVLQTKLYEMLAHQIQQQKVAQVEADFAFKVLEPPSTPDEPYRPSPPLDVILAGVVAMIVSTLVIFMREWFARIERQAK